MMAPSITINWLWQIEPEFIGTIRLTLLKTEVIRFRTTSAKIQSKPDTQKPDDVMESQLSDFISTLSGTY